MMGLADHAFEIVDALQNAKSQSEVFSILSRAGAYVGLDNFVITGLPLPGEELIPYIVLSGCSTDWLERYSANDYAINDPIACKLMGTTEPFRWSSAVSGSKVSERGKVIMGEASEFGLREGFACPIISLNAQAACVSFGGQECEMSRDDEAALYLISTYSYSAAKSFIEDIEPDFIDDLTARETEVIKWLSVGKTGWEISKIISVSEKTVEKHCSAIYAKLGVSNKTHAVAIAMRQRLIL
jgi:LuxR family transcriptional regulator, quorum-sensing system regulator BjaR1